MKTQDSVQIFMTHYILCACIHSVIYRRHVIRARECRREFTDIFREIINSGNGDVAIKAGIYPSTPTRSRREKRSVISNLSDVETILLPIYISFVTFSLHISIQTRKLKFLHHLDYLE